jgi:hypothetical protein
MLKDFNAVSFPLQKVWQLAGPVLVAQSSIEKELSDKTTEEKLAIVSKTWWQVLETTRHMLAHPSIADKDDLLEIVLKNLRALLLVARVDITTQQKWKWLGDEMLVSLKKPDIEGKNKGKIWVDKIPSVLLASLEHPSYHDLLSDFDAMESGEHASILKMCRQIFGHVTYRLKARDEDNWRASAIEFKFL